MSFPVKASIGAALAGAFVLGALFVAYPAAQTSGPADGAEPAPISRPAEAPPPETSFSDLQEDEIRELVRDYLLRNPEVIIEAVNEYSRRQREVADAQARAIAADSLSALLDPKGGFVAGKKPENAKIAVVEFYDYHCGYCKRAAPLMKDLIAKESDVKVVFRELPVLREESDYVAEMSLAAREQDKFLDFHFAMMEASGVLTPERVKEISKKAGLDVKALEKARENRAIPATINESQVLAGGMGLDGTPAFIIASVDGSYVDVVPGFRADAILASIDEARKAAQ